MESQVVGKVVAVTGKAILEHNGKSISLENGSPVFKGGVLVTKADAHIEVRFVDDTMLSQGENSQVSIDDYVFDQPDSASSILLNLTEGTLRTITGKIAEENPEGFEVKSPLATLGIRGTDFSVIHVTKPAPKTDVVLNQIGENHILIVSDQFGNIRYQNDPGTFVVVKADEPISIVETLSEFERQKVLDLTPFSVLPNNGIIEEGNSLPDGASIETGKGSADLDTTQTDQGETDSTEAVITLTESGASTTPGGSKAASVAQTYGISDAGPAGAGISDLSDGLMESLDQPFDISILDDLPPPGAGPESNELPVTLFSQDLYDPFASSFSVNDPFSPVSYATYQPVASLYAPASSTVLTSEPTSVYSSGLTSEPAEQISGVESTPDSDAVLVSAAPAITQPSPTPQTTIQQSATPQAPQPQTAQSIPAATPQALSSTSQPATTAQPPASTSPPQATSNDQVLVAGNSGATLSGGDGNDTLLGGQGVDALYGGAGNDSFIVLGGFAAGVYSGTLPGNTDLSSASPAYQADAVIDGGTGYDTLISYGDANYTGVGINSIEAIQIHSIVTFTPDQFGSITSLTGEGTGSHSVTFTTASQGPATIDLSSVTISNIDQITIDSGITAVVTPQNLNALTPTGTDPALSGAGTIQTAPGVDFSDFVDIYENDVADSLTLGRAPTDILLSNTSIDAAETAGSSVGTISVIDPDEGDAHTYTTSSNYFTISGFKPCFKY